MKNLHLFLILVFITSTGVQLKSENRPRVFVFTDINIDSGDPDDRQSLIHLLWYADELLIEGVVPDRWDARGLEACQLAAKAYAKDYQQYNFSKKGFPDPETINNIFAINREDAIKRFQEAASVENDPLYVLIWGSMSLFGDALRSKPEVAGNIRVITIGTDLMIEDYRQHIPANWETTEKPCEQYNWNGHGRNVLFNDPRFNNMWWLEMNWTYEGMFTGEEPGEIFHKLAQYGQLGQHMKEVVKKEEWAQYFRVGDTPSVLYVIDRGHNPDDPTKASWAGKFTKPFPGKRPNYYADFNGPVEWNYNNPCETWENHTAFRDHAKSTLETQRPEMYNALLKKLDKVYNKSKRNRRN
jgi:hypothetical protein